MRRSLRDEVNKKGAFEASEQEAWLNIIRTAAVLNSAFTKLFRKHGLSDPSYNVLRILRGSGPEGRPMGEIAPDLVAPGPDVTRIVDRLETKGLVSRTRGAKDRRVVRVTISEAGLERLRALDEPLMALHKAQLGHMSASDLQQLSRLLEEARSETDPDAEPGLASDNSSPPDHSA
ncbi:MAG: MarR family transcriptional regulator [Planctomycetota bacterium]